MCERRGVENQYLLWMTHPVHCIGVFPNIMNFKINPHLHFFFSVVKRIKCKIDRTFSNFTVAFLWTFAYVCASIMKKEGGDFIFHIIYVHFLIKFHSIAFCMPYGFSIVCSLMTLYHWNNSKYFSQTIKFEIDATRWW